MFNFFPIIFGIIFFLIIGVFVVVIVKGLTQWNKNNNSPVLTVEAKVVAKRADVSHHTHHNTDSTGMHHTSSSTTYYVTFQVESGDRMELHVPNSEYGMLVEGDEGRLTFQGTRFKGFERAY
ncbi:DUF2500 domain-containing protein [Mobilitalea sibirica]|uniref:DUF2500 domain-containing protein n=2 Tax=Mobilitalea sibirica TaxID=1462919 RepID=A0A8J7L369_9FIRM|nr:DUF2500 domain-containing protein [Mobilitalea sibirica]